MFGTHTSLPNGDQEAREIALHILFYQPLPMPGDNDIPQIIRNSFSMKNVREWLNPNGFADFCGDVQKQIDHIRALRRLCGNFLADAARFDPKYNPYKAEMRAAKPEIAGLLDQQEHPLNQRIEEDFRAALKIYTETFDPRYKTLLEEIMRDQ